MWCPKCQADVAAEVTSDHKRVLCAVCTAEIGGVHSSTLALEKTREARELLERWSNSRFTDPYGPVAAKASTAGAPAITEKQPVVPIETPALPSISEPTAPPEPRPRIPGKGPHFRNRQRIAQTYATSDAHSVAAIDSSEVLSPVASRQQTESVQTARYDAGHFASSPQFDVHQAIAHKRNPATNWNTLIGQLLAYGGVALLTIGAVLVLWGYFGKVEAYVPTGWLVLTAGQMLFFLGGVTLVSGGVEQVTEEVGRRIDGLSARILRFEQSHNHALRGPSIPAERFANATDGAAAPIREQARVS